MPTNTTAPSRAEHRSAILDEFPLTMRFASDHRTVTICEIVDHSTGHIYTGTAKCAPCDLFDEELGMALSLSRALFCFGADVTKSVFDAKITAEELVRGVGIRELREID